MANPFLYTEDDIDETRSSNPFFDANPNDITADNPFLSESNPFASFGETENVISQQYIDPPQLLYQPDVFIDNCSNELLDLGGDKENQIQNSVDVNENNRSKKSPPERPTPPSNMQDLISTLSSQLDMTSNKLLGQIPATRTPSPVSMRDLHSPSPTPETQFDDLLGACEGKDFDEQSAQDALMVDLMDTDNVNVIPTTKTKEDILNLFNPPTEKKPVDFLCDDNIPFETHVTESSENSEVMVNADELLQIEENEKKNIQIVTEDVDPDTANQFEISVSPKDTTSSNDISETVVASHQNTLVNEETPSNGTAINPFMIESTGEIPEKIEESTQNEAAQTLHTFPENDITQDSMLRTEPMEYQPDKFDLFAVKFEESKSKRNSLTNQDNDFQTKYSPNDAWGSSNIATTDSFGFDADDNFSAMDITSDMIKPHIESDEEHQFNVVIRPQGAITKWTENVSTSVPASKPVQYYQEETGKSISKVKVFKQISIKNDHYWCFEILILIVSSKLYSIKS